MKGLALLYQLNAPSRSTTQPWRRQAAVSRTSRDASGQKHPHPNRRTRREPEALVGWGTRG